MNDMYCFRACVVFLTVFACLTVLGEEKDKDKRRLFNTFFLDGDRVTYVLTLREDRTFELFAPDGQSVRGTFIASDKAIAFPFKGGLRHFEYDFDGKDVKLQPTKQDRPQAGVLLGSLPPIGADSKVIFVCLQNWQQRGLPTAPNRPANVALTTPATTPVPPTVPIVPPVTPAVPVVKPAEPQIATAGQTGPKEVTGTYSWVDDKGRAAVLRLREGGTFDYISPDGHRDGGTYLYVNGELNLDSGFWRRHFLVAEAANGLSFTRRETDVPKLGDGLGEMAPAQGAAIWSKVNDAVAVPPAPVTPIQPLPQQPAVPVATQPVLPVTPPVPVVPVPATQPKPVPAPEPAQTAPAAPQAKPTDLAQLIGSYTHRPNPLVSETWTLAQGGQFEYRDSNGAKVSGTATLNGDLLKLQSGEVVRLFSVGIEDTGALVFTRVAEDAPRILNDLASMSPSVLKSARYDKK
jgi:hypothetical protein